MVCGAVWDEASPIRSAAGWEAEARRVRECLGPSLQVRVRWKPPPPVVSRVAASFFTDAVAAARERAAIPPAFPAGGGPEFPARPEKPGSARF